MKKWILSLSCTLITAASSVQVNGQISWFQNDWPNTDFDKSTIQLSEVVGGGPRKDGIPSIDAPKFDRVSDAPEWISPLEPVIVVELDGEARAYPLQILMYHEIVNDEIRGKAISITFCPLCNASIVFDRSLDGEILEFGTTGLLRKSDLVMYDRQSESWWQQFSGKSIVGKHSGKKLNRIPSTISSFQSFERAFPDGLVLNRDTGFHRPYGKNPYSGYDEINQQPFLLGEKADDRLPPMERVLSITIDNKNKIYPLSSLKEERLIHDVFQSVPMVVVSTGELLSVLDDSNIVDSRLVPEVAVWVSKTTTTNEQLTFVIENGDIYDQQTKSKWNVFGRSIEGKMAGHQLMAVESGIHFAFAWLAFNPDSEIY